jgi:hypothetical protein
MSCFLFADDDDNVQKVNIDELYEKKQRRDQRQISVFNKILNRINKRITTTSRMKHDDKYIWYAVPSFIFGEPLYDQTDCIAYVVVKLAENGFFVKYINPGTLFISWENWVPSYARQEIRKKTGFIVDEKGNLIDRVEKKEDETRTVGIPSNDPRDEPPATRSDCSGTIQGWWNQSSCPCGRPRSSTATRPAPPSQPCQALAISR